MLTDNQNRAAADIRAIVNKAKMKVGSIGSVGFNFERMGVCRIMAESIEDEDELLMAAIDAGADECELDPLDDSQFRVCVAVEGLQDTTRGLRDAGYTVESAHLEMIPKTCIEVTEQDGEANMSVIEALEDLGDVDAVATNMLFQEE